MEFEGRMWTPFSCLCLTFLTKVLAISDDAVLIGGMYNAHPSQEQSAFRHALFQNNIHSNTSIQPLNLMAHNENLDHSDSYVLADKFCTLIRRQVYLLVGVTSMSSLPSIKSYSNTFHIPYITPSLSGTEMGTKSSDYLIYMRPSPIPVLAGLIKYHKWDKFNYLYDDTEDVRHGMHCVSGRTAPQYFLCTLQFARYSWTHPTTCQRVSRHKLQRIGQNGKKYHEVTVVPERTPQYARRFWTHATAFQIMMCLDVHNNASGVIGRMPQRGMRF
ncbi:glutamate receptor-like [Saccoglossus kowalevskii]|uniref:Uncharacterized protein LOC102807502 n=1 Tax=Saccoglossus kowalevskii TaxID=10224 RepID=A0ABM0LVP7_SACKO|nr:PREDICTED: uncharacterized protein LOC102807502 [Saccoglossus kowalevskii]